MVDRGLAGDNPWLGQRVKPGGRMVLCKYVPYSKALIYNYIIEGA